ncbi:MAG TPA: Uma2 family endonuclease [Thermomicrobiales bacterium]|nr:Uma2 family endonuclease [Thermomicrobiales bacterium]
MMTSPQEYREAVLEVLPPQGDWSEEDYLWLTDHVTRPIEFSDGNLEVLPMPTSKHQAILRFLLFVFYHYLQPRGGIVLFAPLRVRLRSGKFRESDLLALLDAGDPRFQNRYWLGADLVLEVVSEDEPERDLVTKRREYAESGIPEYWIVNPLDQTVTVLVLRSTQYAEHGHFLRGTTATSALLPGFSVSVDAIFDAV